MSLFERGGRDEFSRGARTLLVCPDLPGGRRSDSAARLEEAKGLARAIGLNVCASLEYRVRAPRAATLLGGGQTEEVVAVVLEQEIELVIVDAALTPIQQRNLEERCKCKIIDRTGLILEIFGERAATAEGRLQVELAHLDYQAGRLVRSWTHLERQRGGFGFLGGPGETQIEADRRMIRDRMAKLRRDLEKVQQTRGLHRMRRKRTPWPVIALVGYTNAGKSTLFNRLTAAEVLAENMLFATLDPTLREIALPGVEKAILSDTVGFVSDLPTQLIAAFRATLEEVITADIIVHVRDIAHPATDTQRADVMGILAELSVVDGGEGGPAYVEIWNKVDLLSTEEKAEIADRVDHSSVPTLPVSAITGQGIDGLRIWLSERINAGNLLREIQVDAANGAALAWLHANGSLKKLDCDDAEYQSLKVSLSVENWGRFEQQFDFQFLS